MWDLKVKAEMSLSAVDAAEKLRETLHSFSFQDHVDALLFALATLVTNESEEVAALMGTAEDRRAYLRARLDEIIGQVREVNDETRKENLDS